jgi:hypothetical protein
MDLGRGSTVFILEHELRERHVRSLVHGGVQNTEVLAEPKVREDPTHTEDKPYPFEAFSLPNIRCCVLAEEPVPQPILPDEF